MSKIATARRIDLSALGFPASFRWEPVSNTGTVEADVPQEELQAAVDAAPTDNTEQHRSIVDQAISDAIAELLDLAAAPALPTVPTIPAGTFTTAQLSDYIRSIRTVIAAQRDANQATRVGAQRVAETLANKIRLDRGDFAHLDD